MHRGLHCSYQKTAYNAARISVMIRPPTAKPVDVRNILVSTSSEFTLLPLAFSIMEIMYIPQQQKTNTLLPEDGVQSSKYNSNYYSADRKTPVSFKHVYIYF